MTEPHPIPGPGRFIPASDLHAFRASPLDALVKLARRYGDLFAYPVGFWTIYVVNQPDLLQTILQERPRLYRKDTFQYQLLQAVTGQGLLTNTGDSWLSQRRLMQPAFHRARLAELGAGMVALAEQAGQRWAEAARRQAPLDIDHEMMHLTLAIVGRALFSVELSAEADELARAILVALEHLIFRATTPIAPPPPIPTPRNRRFAAALQQLDRAVYRLIADRRAQGPGPGDLLDMLMAARDAETGAAMSDRQLRDELVTLIVAGHETVASALTWCWYLLARHPLVERTLDEELGRVLGGRLPTVADLPQLPYTRMVIDETLRLYPPAWVMTRRAQQADELGGYRLPAGALMVLSPYVTHRHPALWPNPEGFDPLRFTPEAVAARPRFAYYPFGGGPHLCIGNHFSLLECQLVLATLAQRFRLALVPGRPVAVKPLVTLRPKAGLWATVSEK